MECSQFFFSLIWFHFISIAPLFPRKRHTEKGLSVCPRQIDVIAHWILNITPGWMLSIHIYTLYIYIPFLAHTRIQWTIHKMLLLSLCRCGCLLFSLEKHFSMGTVIWKCCARCDKKIHTIYTRSGYYLLLIKCLLRVNWLCERERVIMRKCNPIQNIFLGPHRLVSVGLFSFFLASFTLSYSSLYLGMPIWLTCILHFISHCENNRCVCLSLYLSLNWRNNQTIT